MQKEKGRKYTRYSLQFCPSPLDKSRPVWIPGWTVSSWNLFTLSLPHLYSNHCAHHFQKWRAEVLYILTFYCGTVVTFGTKGSLNPGDSFFPTCRQESKKNTKQPQSKTKGCCSLRYGPGHSTPCVRPHFIIEVLIKQGGCVSNHYIRVHTAKEWVTYIRICLGIDQRQLRSWG